MVSWKRLTRWCRRRLIHLHNQNKHPHPLIWARGFAPPPKKTSLLTKSSLSSWFVQHSQPRAFVLPLLSWKILLVYFFQFGHFGGSVIDDHHNSYRNLYSHHQLNIILSLTSSSTKGSIIINCNGFLWWIMVHLSLCISLPPT